MLNTYKAKLKGDHIEWAENPPPALNGGTTDVLVTIMPPGQPAHDDNAEMRRQRVAALERIAARGGIQSIPDAVAWQREMREDRPLPGRE